MKGRGAEKPKGDSREAGHSQEMGWGGARDATKLRVKARSLKILNANLRKLNFTIKYVEGFTQARKYCDQSCILEKLISIIKYTI